MVVGASGSVVSAAMQPERSARLRRVVDGDTLELRDGARVRLIGIDTPETVHPDFGDECYGAQASRFTERLLRPGDALRLVFDVERFDRYGRLLAYVYRAADDVFVNARIVSRGYAYVETIPPNVAHAERFRRLARKARERELGLWSACPNDGTGPTSESNRCLPDYRGACVPPPPPDLDCDDLGRPVRIVGDDPHSLDADGDGRACERAGPR
jgi:micrococcal nuclease